MPEHTDTLKKARAIWRQVRAFRPHMAGVGRFGRLCRPRRRPLDFGLYHNNFRPRRRQTRPGDYAGSALHAAVRDLFVDPTTPVRKRNFSVSRLRRTLRKNEHLMPHVRQCPPARGRRKIPTPRNHRIVRQVLIPAADGHRPRIKSEIRNNCQNQKPNDQNRQRDFAKWFLPRSGYIPQPSVAQRTLGEGNHHLLLRRRRYTTLLYNAFGVRVDLEPKPRVARLRR